MGYDPRFRLRPVWMMWSYTDICNWKRFEISKILHAYIVNVMLILHILPAQKSLLHYSNEIIIDEETVIYCNILYTLNRWLIFSLPPSLSYIHNTLKPMTHISHSRGKYSYNDSLNINDYDVIWFTWYSFHHICLT